MQILEENQPINLRANLINLGDYRLNDRTAGGKPDALVIHAAYAFPTMVYKNGQVLELDNVAYMQFERAYPNETVSKFGQVYVTGAPLLLHKRLADVLIDAAIDLRDHRGQFTVVMDALRTYDSGLVMQQRRPDLVELSMLAKAGDSAHNRALAVDSKLFEPDDIDFAELPKGKVPLHMLKEADEHGHLDDTNMETNNRFYNGPMSDTARQNRLIRLQAWQRAAVKNRLPIANLISEFWDDRVTGGPADMWRVLTCRALCIGMDGNPKTSPAIAELREQLRVLHTQNSEKIITRQVFALLAHALFQKAWDAFFDQEQKQELHHLLGKGGAKAPSLEQFMFHEWLNDIYCADLPKAGFTKQSIAAKLQASS